MIITSDSLPEEFSFSVVTIGNFDGVHLGHKAVFNEVKRIARETGRRSVVVSFREHPRKVLYPEKPLPVLTTYAERVKLIEEAGIDALVLLDFTHEMSQMHAREFVRKIVLDKIGASHIVLGYDHAFGKNREGNIDALNELSSVCGFEVTRLDPFVIGGHPVSSSRIRTLLSDGEVESAAECLGRPYEVSGTVIEGFKRGRTIGFPTANLMSDNPDKILPEDGVYATRVRLCCGEYAAVTNVGKNPTFGDGARTVETHILDYSGDIYGNKLTVSFIARIRGESRFGSPDELVAAIKKDVSSAREILSRA